MLRWAYGLVLAAAVLIVPAVALAQPPVAVETTPGGSLRPSGDTTIAVLSEHLLLDLTEREGRIKATYQLHNPTDGMVDLSVAFPMPPWVLGEWKVAVMLDGLAYPVRSALGPVALYEGELSLHAHWLDPFTGIAYWPPKVAEPVTPQYLIFGVSFLPGQQRQLSVEYRQFPGEDYSRLIEPARRFDHLLQPARHWAGFGDLTIEVRVPKGYQMATVMPLVSQGDGSYAAHFTELPVGNLSIFLAPGPGPRWWWDRTGRALFLAALALLTGVIAGLAAASRRALVTGGGLLFTCLVVVLLYWVTPPHLLRTDPTGAMFLWLLFIPSLLALHLISRGLTRWLAQRLTLRQERRSDTHG
ncbi:MAG: hypothetical protein K0R39_2800 [Symbiobacteriaceae bacterium]|jgi:hypothetical protein|nr:hypothetical protein [Symbiobacteriaceae bacterium]